MRKPYINRYTKLLSVAASGVFRRKQQDSRLNAGNKYAGIGFDPHWYITNNPDVAQAGIDGVRHFETSGINEGRHPHAFYSADWHNEMNRADADQPGGALRHLVKTRSDGTRKTAAFFGYAWNSARRPDPYIRAVIDALTDLGINVDVYIGGQFASAESTRGFRADVPRSDLSRFVRSKSYDFAISFNNALVMPDTVDALDCTIVSVIVDSVHHLFDHDKGGPHSAFKLQFHAAPIYTSLVDDLAKVPNVNAETSFIPAATQVIGRADVSKDRPIAVSWIASILGDYHLDQFTSRVDSEVSDGLELMDRCLNDIAITGSIGAAPASQDAAKILCEWSHWDYPLLEMHLQEIATNRDRINIVEQLAPLGLRLFGNARWRNYFAISPAVVRSFKSGAELRTHADICAVYDRSKISVNCPQVHAGTGMQYRVLDILASKSLLITKRIPNSDMEGLFGADSPIVTYTDIGDLRDKCEYYLRNDAERDARIRECNQLVASGFSFRERVQDYLKISNSQAAQEVGQALGRGSSTLIWPEAVVDWAFGQRAKSGTANAGNPHDAHREPFRAEPTFTMLGGVGWSDIDVPSLPSQARP